MKKWIKYQLIAFAIGWSVAMAFDFLTVHPESLTDNERRQQGHLVVSFIYI